MGFRLVPRPVGMIPTSSSCTGGGCLGPQRALAADVKSVIR